MKLLVLAKAPVAGRVKTRLCPPLDGAQAAAVAEAALADTLDAVVATGAQEYVLALDGQPGPWLPPGLRVVPQRGRTFAQRLACAWADCGGPALQIGMDTPQATPALLDAAMSTLTDHDSVLGPTPDGGWWALGLHTHHPTMFEGVPMSLPTTGSHQRRRLVELGLRPRELGPLTDVDTWEDAVSVAATAPQGRFGRLVHELSRTVIHPCAHDDQPLVTGRAR